MACGVPTGCRTGGHQLCPHSGHPVPKQSLARLLDSTVEPGVLVQPPLLPTHFGTLWRCPSPLCQGTLGTGQALATVSFPSHHLPWGAVGKLRQGRCHGAGGGHRPQPGPECGSADCGRGAIYSRSCHVLDVCGSTGGVAGSGQAAPALLHVPVPLLCRGAEGDPVPAPSPHREAERGPWPSHASPGRRVQRVPAFPHPWAELSRAWAAPPLLPTGHGGRTLLCASPVAVTQPHGVEPRHTATAAGRKRLATCVTAVTPW